VCPPGPGSAGRGPRTSPRSPARSGASENRMRSIVVGSSGCQTNSSSPGQVVADPRHFNADPDPTFHFNADPSPSPFNVDPESKTYADQCGSESATLVLG
jgi:hypothetical protein